MPPLRNPFDALVGLLDRLRYPWKFAAVAIVFSAATMLFLYQIHAGHRGALSAVEGEIAGLEVAHAAMDLLVEVQLHRGLSSAARHPGSEALAARIPALKTAVRDDIAHMDTLLEHAPALSALRESWQIRRSALLAMLSDTGDTRDTFERHSALIRHLIIWMQDIDDETGLARRADPALAHLIVAQLRTLPHFIESVANLRGTAIGAFLIGADDAGTRMDLAARLGAVRIADSALHERIERIATLAPGGVDMDSSEMRTLHATLRHLLNTAALGISSGLREIDSVDFFVTATATIDQVAALAHDTLHPLALAMLETRRDQVRRQLWGTVAQSLAALVLVAVLFAAMYTSIRRAVAELQRGSERFAAGALDARVKVASRDELRQVGTHFNAMAHSITKLIETQRIQADRLAELLANNPSVVFTLDPASLRCRFVSPNAHKLFGELLPTDDEERSWLELIRAQPRAALENALRGWRDGGFVGTVRGAYPLIEELGAASWVEVQLSAVTDEAGEVIELVGSCTDITEQQHAATQLELAASVFNNAREGIMITDAEANIIDVNDAFTAITGWPRAEVIGRNPRLLQSGWQDADFYTEMWSALARDGFWEGEIWNRRRTGEQFAETLSICAVRSSETEAVSHYVALFSDITRQKESERRLRQLAHFDTLTGLPNRSLIADRLKQALACCKRSGKQLAVALIDLDGFKAVNDTYGHEAGDELLVTVSRRMESSLRTVDTVGRLGGDEFIALLGELDRADDIETPLQRLLEAVAQPIELGYATVGVRASIGVSLYPQHEPIDAEQLVRQADQAMYAVKRAGKNGYRLFSELDG